MRKIETQIIIKATSEKVWNILMDFDTYSEWNPFIKFISGDKNIGNNLLVKIQPDKDKIMTFKPIILKVDKNKEFRWLGKFLFKGLFDGEHYFILSQTSEGYTTLIHGEIFNGMLVGLLKGILNKTEEGFKTMNVALKDKAEAVVK